MSTDEKKFALGDEVEWTSGAGGTLATKIGKVLEVVPKGCLPTPIIRGMGSSRNHESYVVAVTMVIQNGPKKLKQGVYWPRVKHLQPHSRKCQPPVVGSTKNANTKEPKVETTKLVNHFVICLDRSGSMQPIHRTAVDTYNQNAQSIREGARKSGQEATISFTTFGGNIQTHHFCDPVDNLKTYEYHDYRPQGSTPLFDSVAQMISKLRDRKDSEDKNVSYMFIVITDGEENSSRIRTKEFNRLVAEVQRTDRWSFAFLVPPGTARSFCYNFSIPEGNVKEWEATALGMQEAARSVDAGISSYYATRASGRKSTSGFFQTDMTKVSVHEVKNRLVDIRDKVRIIEVNRTSPIREFVERELGQVYQTGRAFYQLMKDEKVQYHKKVMLRARGDNAVYAGTEARHLLGLPDGVDVRVRPGDHANWDIFVQSTSVNRKLLPGTKLLYLL